MSYANITSNNTIFNHKYLLLQFDYDKMDESNSNRVRMLNINLVNSTQFNLLNILVALQTTFIRTNCFCDMNLFSRKDILYFYEMKHALYLDSSIITKLFSTKTILINNIRYELKQLLPKKNFLYSLYIKKIILKDPAAMTDDKVSTILKTQYNVNITRRDICYIRDKYLIPSVSKRDKVNFHTYVKKFFVLKFLLNKENVYNMPEVKGVYQLSTSSVQNYPLHKIDIVYIGSSKTLKTRLIAYFTNNGHTQRIRDFISTNTIYFSTYQTTHYKEYEKVLLDEFEIMCGSLPLLNKNRILK
jgi:hypothetical protein